MDTITTEQQVEYSVVLKDGMGRPQEFEGDPVVETSDPTVATVAIKDRTTLLVSAQTPGTCRVLAKLDTDLNPDVVNESIGMADVEVTLDPRTGQRIVTLTAGTPTDKPVT